MCEMPYALGRSGQCGPGVAQPVACVQVPPPSVLRQMPPSLTVRYCDVVVAMIVFGSSRGDRDVDRLEVRQSIEVLPAGAAVERAEQAAGFGRDDHALLVGRGDAIESARPPCVTRGGEMVVVEEQPASTKTSNAAMRACMTIPSLIGPCTRRKRRKGCVCDICRIAGPPRGGGSVQRAVGLRIERIDRDDFVARVARFVAGDRIRPSRSRRRRGRDRRACSPARDRACRRAPRRAAWSRPESRARPCRARLRARRGRASLGGGTKTSPVRLMRASRSSRIVARDFARRAGPTAAGSARRAERSPSSAETRPSAPAGCRARRPALPARGRGKARRSSARARSSTRSSASS